MAQDIWIEHAEYPVEKIAVEKAGIIKENGILITTEKNKSVLNLFKRLCKQKNSKFIQVKLNYKGKLSLNGDFQKRNAALAEAVALQLKIKSYKED